jgi:hypothetical protein
MRISYMNAKLYGIDLWKKLFEIFKKINIIYECMKSMIKEWGDIVVIYIYIYNDECIFIQKIYKFS